VARNAWKSGERPGLRQAVKQLNQLMRKQREWLCR